MQLLKIGVLNLLILVFTSVFAQKPKQLSSSEIELGLKKLDVLASVLYVAAHPDDENTRLIAYFSNEVLANTAYLSMTRGDGGQNLIGPEIREYLGIIRTQELLAARRTDGSTQMFTRANDFGYSKSPEETQEIWNRDEVLSDVVRAFRKFRPDVIITRFPTDGGGGHGHHTASAILAGEAFALASDKSKYPDQVSKYGIWQPRRLYLNTGRWWNSTINENTPGVVTIDVGKYNELLGESYTETAARSRTMHKSQGFGSTGSRGEELEFLEYRHGEKVSNDIFEGIDTSWSRVEGGEKVSKLISEAIKNYNSSKPYGIVDELLAVKKAIGSIKDNYWREIKLNEVNNLIKNCLGLYVEAVSSQYLLTAGEETTISFEAINRSPVPVFLKRVVLNGVSGDTTMQVNLLNNTKASFGMSAIIPENFKISQPYWLEKEGTLGAYRVDDASLIGLPENKPAITATYSMDVLGSSFTLEVPVAYKWNDPVKGEQHRPTVIAPDVFINIKGNVHVFSSIEPKQIEITVKAAKNNVSGKVMPVLPSGWKSTPESVEFKISDKLDESKFNFEITPPEGQSEGFIQFVAEVGSKKIQKSFVEISYDHFPTQVVYPEAKSKIVKLDIAKRGQNIGYIQGAGDDIPSSLRNIGYSVTELNDEEIALEKLQSFDAVVLGVRALNTRDKLAFAMPDLLNYVKEGGTLILQYNTSFRLKNEDFSPYPLTLSRDRVSIEEAKVTILAPDHPVMNVPNKITEKDFDGWVQERGLYFPNEWSEEFTPILSSHDPGEPAREGGLLVAKYGKGNYVYTGFSWFRELPAGVPGAYRIFANIVSLGSNSEASDTLNGSK